MGHIIFGVYLFVSALSAILFLLALAAAKQSDERDMSESQITVPSKKIKSGNNLETVFR